MAVILAGAAGFLAGVLVMLLVGLLRLTRAGSTARRPRQRARAKEFTQLLVLSDGGLVWATTIGYMILAAYAIYKGYQGALPWLTAPRRRPLPAGAPCGPSSSKNQKNRTSRAGSPTTSP